jgi:hypothetical protein
VSVAKYKVQGPDGAIHVFEGPDGASQEQVIAFAQQHFGKQESPAAKAMDPKEFAPDDPGAIMSALIGAGWTFDRVIKGMQQLYLGAKSKVESPTVSSLVTGRTDTQKQLDDLKSRADEEKRLYEPLAQKHPIATAIGETLPALAIPVGGSATLPATIAKLAVAGAAPGALEYGTAGERAKRAAVGGTAAVVGGTLVPKAVEATVKGVPAVGRAVRAAVEPLSEKGRAAIAGRTLVNASGDDAATVAQRLAQASELIPKSAPTAAQVAENGGIAALERSVSAAQPADFAQRGMEQAAARTGALRGIARDDTARAAAVTARGTATKPLYDAAKSQQVDVDKALTELLRRPSVQKALERARAIAQEEGRSFEFPAVAGHAHGAPKAPAGPAGIVDESGAVLVDLTTPKGPQKVSGQTLQDLKMGMDALLKDPTSGIAGKEAELVKETRGMLMNWMESRIPSLKEARTKYAGMSKPIGQMDVGRQLLRDIEPALSDFGALGKETASKYATALRNADQTAVKATKFKGAGMRDLMTPDQMGTIEAVASDLARKANAQDLGRGVGSDTFQKLALSNIAERSGAPGVVGTALDLPGVSRVAKFLYREPEEKIQTIIAKSLLEPKTAAQLMEQAIKAGKPQPIGNILFANPGRAAQIGGALPALAGTELFAR